MAALAPAFGDVELVPVGDWMPSRYTATLTGTEEFCTDGDRLLAFVDEHWRSAESFGFTLDGWQRWLIRHLLEKYPPDWPVERLRGQLRYRQAVVSIGRQNGKSVVGAVLAFYFAALHVRGPRVVGLASVESQAKIVYDRVKYSVDNNPTLKQVLRATSTRGINHRDGSGGYKTMPAKMETAQGEPISGCLYDELHIGNTALWDAIIEGQKARRNSLMIGITTAGDDDSLLLKRLYAEGEKAIAGKDERFGFFAWEATTEKFTKQYLPTAEDIISANPAVACGRVDLEDVLAAALKQWHAPKDEDGIPGRDKVIRFTLNRFVEGSADAWVSSAIFSGLVGDVSALAEGEIVFGLDRTEDWSHATITAATKRDGQLLTEVVATLNDPTHKILIDVCKALAVRGRTTFVMPYDTLRPLGKELRDDHGLTVWILGASEMQDVSGSASAAMVRGAVTHAGDPLVKYQIQRAKRRDMGDAGGRISRTLSATDIDAVIATAVALHVAEIQPELTVDLS